MALNIETVLEEGVLQTNNVEEDSKVSVVTRKWLISLSLVLNVLGIVGGPILLRFYFLHGGSLVWTASWLQCAGFPVLLVPLVFIYFHERTPFLEFLASPKLYMWSVAIGLISAPVSLMLSYGSSYLPVSTSQLLLSTQLVFTSVFAFIIVRQKFTPYMINAIVVLTIGPVLLGLRKNADRPPGVSSTDYSLGFFLTIGAAGLYALSLPCSEFAYRKINKAMTCSWMLQFLFGVNFTATSIYTIGMLVKKNFKAIPIEANQFEFGPTKYYFVLVCTALVWQMALLGTFGLIYLTSSIFVGIFASGLLPVTEIMAAIIFHEKFTGEKGAALALCLWGFTSYFYGSYLEMKKHKQIRVENEQN